MAGLLADTRTYHWICCNWQGERGIRGVGDYLLRSEALFVSAVKGPCLRLDVL